ncbi:hypothetical protein GOBAR_DD09725 [Gossypium barbadense]|nr:hypothetical protein GOBAR_DD09725 [Gossypium barbadense]
MDKTPPQVVKINYGSSLNWKIGEAGVAAIARNGNGDIADRTNSLMHVSTALAAEAQAIRLGSILAADNNWQNCNRAVDWIAGKTRIHSCPSNWAQVPPVALPYSLIFVKFVECWELCLPTTTGINNSYFELLDFHILYCCVIIPGNSCGALYMAFHLLGIQDLILAYIFSIILALKHSIKHKKHVLATT